MRSTNRAVSRFSCTRKRLSIISIGIGIAIGIGIEFGRAWLIRLQFFKPKVFDAEADHDADADSGENRQSRKSAVSLLLLLLCTSGALAQPSAMGQSGAAGTVQLDPQHTVVAFKLSGSLHDVHGTFALRSGSLTIDAATGDASGTLVVDAGSGASGNNSRDARMASEVLESDCFPEIRFAARHIDVRQQADGAFEAILRGVLSIHGADHVIEVTADGRLNGDRLTARARFAVPYVAWGMTDPSVLLLTVAKEVEIEVSTSAQVVWKSPSKENQ